MKRASLALATLALLLSQQIVSLVALQQPAGDGQPQNVAGQVAAVAGGDTISVVDALAEGKQSMSDTANLATIDGDLIAAETSQPPADEQQSVVAKPVVPIRQNEPSSAPQQVPNGQFFAQQLPQQVPQQQLQQQQQQPPPPPPQVPQPQQQQPQLPPQLQQHQQQIQHQQKPPQPQQPVFNFNAAHMHQLQSRIVAQQQPPQVGPQKNVFSPFMNAALAGNYGPAQQQIAAAHAAAAHQLRMNNPNMHQNALPPQAAHLVQQQQQQQPQLNHRQQPFVNQPQPPQQIPQQQQQPPHMQINLDQHHQNGQLAVQESLIRPSAIPAPAFVQQQQQPAPQVVDASNAIDSSAEQSGAHAIVAQASNGNAVVAASDQWPLPTPDIPKIVNLEVKCEKNLMKVSIEFDKAFNGIIFSKGHYNQNQCLHFNPNSNKQQAYFDISINSCGTQGNLHQGGHYGLTAPNASGGGGSFFENTIVIQYDPNVQEVWDQARKLRCTWHDHYEKAVTFRPFPVDMLDIVRADFAGDNVGCWMQIQVGKGPWASEVAGIVKIGQTMTMVLAIKDEENKFDMLVRNCFAHDGKRGPIELVDKNGCISRPKLMSKFTKIKNFGSSATVLSYAQFQAFKFPDSMEVHFQCTIQICRHQCPEQCFSSSSSSSSASNQHSSSSPSPANANNNGEVYGESTISGTLNINGGRDLLPASSTADSAHIRKLGATLSRARRDLSSLNATPGNFSAAHQLRRQHRHAQLQQQAAVGLNKVIQVVSGNDLAFSLQPQAAAQQQQQQVVEGELLSAETRLAAADESATLAQTASQVCMSSYNYVVSVLAMLLTLLVSSLFSVSLYLRQRAMSARASNKQLQFAAAAVAAAHQQSSARQVPISQSGYMQYR